MASFNRANLRLGVLRALFLRGGDQTAGAMGGPNGAIGLVDVLAPRTAGAQGLVVNVFSLQIRDKGLAPAARATPTNQFLRLWPGRNGLSPIHRTVPVRSATNAGACWPLTRIKQR